jgi:hypothetical protein
MFNEEEYFLAVRDEDCSPKVLDKVLSFWFGKDPEQATSVRLFQASLIAAQHPNLSRESLQFFVSGLLSHKWGTTCSTVREQIALLMLLHPSCPEDLVNYAKTESNMPVVREAASLATKNLNTVTV